MLRDERVLVSTWSGDERVDGRQALFVLPQLRAHLGVDRHVRDELAGRRRQVGVGLGEVLEGGVAEDLRRRAIVMVGGRDCREVGVRVRVRVLCGEARAAEDAPA